MRENPENSKTCGRVLKAWCSFGRVGDTILYFSLALSPIVGSVPTLVSSYFGSAISLFGYGKEPLDKYVKKKQEFTALIEEIKEQHQQESIRNKRHLDMLIKALDQEDDFEEGDHKGEDLKGHGQVVSTYESKAFRTYNRIQQLDNAFKGPQSDEITQLDIVLDTFSREHDALVGTAKGYLACNTVAILFWLLVNTISALTVDACANSGKAEKNLWLTYILPIGSGFIFLCTAFFSFRTALKIESRQEKFLEDIKHYQKKPRRLDIDSQLTEAVDAKIIALQIWVHQHAILERRAFLRAEAGEYQQEIQTLTINKDKATSQAELQHWQAIKRMVSPPHRGGRGRGGDEKASVGQGQRARFIVGPCGPRSVALPSEGALRPLSSH